MNRSASEAEPTSKSGLSALEQLLKYGHRYVFETAVSTALEQFPGAVAPGELGPLNQEPIRFRHDPRLIFSPSDISQIALRDDARGHTKLEITTAFLGLIGATSPMATYFTEEVLAAESRDEPALRVFLDVFHHRLLSLLYRALRKYRLATGSTPERDVVMRRVLSFVGVDPKSSSQTRGFDAFALVGLAPLMATRTRSSATLEGVLRATLALWHPDAKVAIEPFILRAAPIAPEQWLLLGSQSTTLGVDTTLGKTVLDRSSNFRVQMGPIAFGPHADLLPGGRHYAELCALVHEFAPEHLWSELELEVTGEASGLRLGSAHGSLLGIDTRLGIIRQASQHVRVPLSGDVGEAKPVFLTPAA